MDRPPKKPKLAPEPSTPPNPNISRQANGPPFSAQPPQLLRQPGVQQPLNPSRPSFTLRQLQTGALPTPPPLTERQVQRVDRIAGNPIHPNCPPGYAPWISPERPQPSIRRVSPVPRQCAPSPTRIARPLLPNGTPVNLTGPDPSTIGDCVWLRTRGYQNQYGFNMRSGIMVNSREDWGRGVAEMTRMREEEQRAWEAANPPPHPFFGFDEEDENDEDDDFVFM